MSQFASALSRLDAWAAERLGMPDVQPSRTAIEHAQLDQLNASIEWMRTRSAFYRPLLARLGCPAFASLDELATLPFTTSADLSQHPHRFLCTSQDSIQRIVTLPTSGTVHAKRIFFTAEDLEQTAGYFAHGVLGVLDPGETLVIALPGLREESVGLQLAHGIERAGVRAHLVSPEADAHSLLDVLEHTQASGVIGLPVHMLALAYAAEQSRSRAFRNLRSLLLCSDHVSASMVAALRTRTRAEIFEHYGMTETGLGFGIDCAAHAGYHFRELDFLVEIVDPCTGHPLPAGREGEIVLTTLTRRGMPLLRYRTGDLSSLTHARCTCGSAVSRLSRISGRIENCVPLGSYGELSLSDLDQVLFSLPGLVDFSAQLAGNELRLHAVIAPGYACTPAAIEQALESLSALRAARRAGEISLLLSTGTDRIVRRSAKRRIEGIVQP